MADKKISDFTAATAVDAADLFEIENAGGNSRKVVASLVRPWNLVSSATASASASLDLSVTAASYREWMLIGDQITLSAQLELVLRVGTGGGPTIDTGANYDWRGNWDYGTSSTGTNSRAFVSATTVIRLGTVAGSSSPSGKPMRVECKIWGLESGISAQITHGLTSYDGSQGCTAMEFSGIYNPTTEITGFRIYTAQTSDGVTASGSITSGSFYLYGRKYP